MAQSAAQDASYQLPTPAGNTGPNTDLAQCVNSLGVTVERQRMEAYLGGKTGVITVGEGGVVISSKPGALRKSLVTTAAGAGAITFYDNPSSASGTIIGIVPSNAPLAQVYNHDMAAVNGIFAVADVASAAVTVDFEQ